MGMPRIDRVGLDASTARSMAPQKLNMPDFCKIAIIAALEREVRPLIQNWHCTRKSCEGHEFKFYENDGIAVVCGGIGPAAARRASEAIINLYHPGLVISAGFAGALDPALELGHAFTPRQVIDAADGSHTDCPEGDSILITFGDVADVEQKTKLGTAYGAHAVDMEAASVARCAQAHGIKFLACKVISDTSDTGLPPIARFISSDGNFHTLQFLAYVAIRPWLWAAVHRLASNSQIAASNLCSMLAETAKANTADWILTR